MTEIKFGTDGWRAVIDQDFTPENIRQVIQAFCDVRLHASPQNKKIILGYDRRLKSSETAEMVAEVLAGNGFHISLSSQFCPTPCVSWMVKSQKASAGVMVTASHNPWQWNGIKFKEEYGGSASPEYTQQVEDALLRGKHAGRPVKSISLGDAKKQGLLENFDPHQAYVEELKSHLDVEIIRKSGFKILVDPLYGAGSGFFPAVLGQQVSEIHNNADPRFGGLNPEPIDKNLGELMKKLKIGSWDVGLATDGDADRIGAVDEQGRFVNSHQIFALLLQHYVEDKHLSGPIVKSISTTQMINALCEKYKLPLVETPIGFKHICKELVTHHAFMGGEESGGLSFAPHVHERDGVLNGLFLVEMMAMRGKKLSQLIDDLYKMIGTFYFRREDLSLGREAILSLEASLRKNPPNVLARTSVVKANLIDGFKYSLEDGSWLLIRASGTEPLVRVYAEAASKEKVDDLIEEGLQLVLGPNR